MNKEKAAEKDERAFGRRDCVSYAVGQVGQDLTFGLRSIMVIFWTQFMGMNASFFAFLLLVVQVWDAVNDPLIGSLTDADTHAYRRNKYLNYLLFSSVGLLFSSALCFVPLPQAPVAAKTALFIGGYLLWDAFYSLSSVALGSLLSRITEDSGQRATLSVARSFGSILAAMLPMMIIPMLVYDQDNNLNGYRLFVVSLVIGTLSLVCLRYMVRNTVVRHDVERRRAARPKVNFRKSIGIFMKNRAIIGVTLASMANYISLNAANTAAAVLFQSYFHNAKMSGVITAAGMLPLFLLTPCIGRIARRFGKREVTTWGLAVGTAVLVLELIVPVPPNGVGIFVHFVCTLLSMLGRGFFLTLYWSMVGDAVDYGEWRYGERCEGVMYAMFSFFGKVMQSLAPSIVLLIMVAMGYVESNQANQTAEFALKMRYFVPALHAAAFVVTLVGVRFVNQLDKRTVEQMQEELHNRVD